MYMSKNDDDNIMGGVIFSSREIVIWEWKNVVELWKESARERERGREKDIDQSIIGKKCLFVLGLVLLLYM